MSSKWRLNTERSVESCQGDGASERMESASLPVLSPRFTFLLYVTTGLCHGVGTRLEGPAYGIKGQSSRTVTAHLGCQLDCKWNQLKPKQLGSPRALIRFLGSGRLTPRMSHTWWQFRWKDVEEESLGICLLILTLSDNSSVLLLWLVLHQPSSGFWCSLKTSSSPGIT